jgi:dephospho-CoA kinase
MITLGVTGGLGSGKSTVCSMFEELGAPLFLADDEAKRLMIEHPALREDLVEAFGEQTYAPDGKLNRRYLADRVFTDPSDLARINAIVHPYVFEAFKAFREKAAREGVPLAIKEAAILFESGGDRHVDHTLLVDAPVSTRIERVVARDGMTPEAAMERIRHQLPSSELRSRADFVLDNDGSLDDLGARVQEIHGRLVRADDAS